MTKQIKNLIASILFVLAGFICDAQVTVRDGTPPPPMPPPPPGLPLKGPMLIVLAVAGLSLGIKKKIEFLK